MPKFNEAYYKDENNNWEVILYRELTNPNNRAIYREKQLFNEINGNKILGIRNHPSTPHFYQKLFLRMNIESGISETVEHNMNQEMIMNFLNKYKKNSFGFYESPWEKEKSDKGFDNIIKLKEYSWGKEVKFGLIHGKYIVFDILGRSDSFNLLDTTPFVAIEVVDTHFHSKETFKVLLALSRNLPILILYYFVSQAPYLNQVSKPLRSNSFTKNRIYHYISDGSFWITNDRLEDTVECDIGPIMIDEYYNYIIDMLRNKSFIR